VCRIGLYYKNFEILKSSTNHVEESSYIEFPNGLCLTVYLRIFPLQTGLEQASNSDTYKIELVQDKHFSLCFLTIEPFKIK
jgi:hypothetical protein